VVSPIVFNKNETKFESESSFTRPLQIFFISFGEKMIKYS
jgi:hypothetical protein